MREFSLVVVLLLTAACSSKHADEKANAAPTDKRQPEPHGQDGDGRTAPAAPSDDAVSPPTAEGLIEQGRQDGKLDAKTAALYQLLARYSPRRIPDPYWAAASSHSLPSVAVEATVRAHLREYGPVEADAARAMLVSPGDPGWLQFPSGMPVLHASQGSAGTCFDQFITDGDPSRYKIFRGAPIATEHFTIQALMPFTGPVKDQEKAAQRVKDALATTVPGFGGKGVVTFKEYLDSVVDNFATMFKNSNPRTLPEPAKRGGKIPIWVLTCDGLTNDAGANGAGDILVSVGLGFEDPVLRRIVLPHEVFHLVESGYTPPFEGKEWPYEAAAVAMEDVIAPDVQRWSGKYAGVTHSDRALPMDRFFKCPEEPLHETFAGPCRNRGAASTDRYRGDYSRFIVFKYVMKRFGRTMESLWEELKLKKGDPSQMTVFHPEVIGALQVELVAERSSRAFIDPADRALFVIPGRPSLDFSSTSTGNRYTYQLDPASLSATVGRRVLPTDTSSKAALTRFDSTALPIKPGATHRWLIKVPKEATNGQGFPAVALVAEPTPDTSGVVYMSLGSLGEVNGAPGRVIDLSADTAIDGSTQLRSLIEWQTRPEYLLATVTNTSETMDVTYKLAVSLPGTCADACADAWLDWWKGKSCPETMCSTAEGSDKATCLGDWKDKAFLKKMGLGLPQQWCGWVCWQHLGTQLDKPFLPQFFDEDHHGADHLLQSAGATRDTKLGFLSLKEWPLSKAACTDFACNGSVGGNCKK